MASSQQRRDVWRNAERHHCTICNVWLGGDRQSILLHENGKKHKDNLEKSFEKKRQDKLNQEKAQTLLQSSLAQVEAAAAKAHALDPTFAASEISLQYSQQQQSGGAAAPFLSSQDDATAAPFLSSQDDATAAPSKVPPNKDATDEKEKQAWESRKKKREASKKKHGVAEEQDEPAAKKRKRKQLAPDEGHYIHGDTTYLEGPSFAELLEEDMPIQIWTGSGFANMAEKKLPEKHHQWRNGLVLAVRKSSKDDSGIVLDVAYLMQPTDEEETLEKSVSPARIRIVLGGDESIPDTLEEARLMVMGEEVTQVEEAVHVDENTGLSSWGTVSIRKTTARSELKEERERIRAKRREQVEKEKEEERAVEARRMEEAKIENADDSALGAYDVWNAGKGGYKGVDINQEAKLDVQDTAKSLAKGKVAVEFKKKALGAFKKTKKKQNRRTTSADDD
jgi:WW domain-binding protein 4